MKTFVILLSLVILPFTSVSQTENTFEKEIISSIIKVKQSNITYSNKRNHTYFTSKTEILKLNYKKSFDLISIKAYRKATQLRSKQLRVC
jgi:hypothetical protein